MKTAFRDPEVAGQGSSNDPGVVVQAGERSQPSGQEIPRFRRQHRSLEGIVLLWILFGVTAFGQLPEDFRIPIPFHAIAVQEDGKVLLASSTNIIERLHPDGTLDPSFHILSTASGSVDTLALMEDGSILASGSFTKERFVVPSQRMGHFGPDGSWLEDFLGTKVGVEFLATLGDGKLLGFGRTLLRLNPDGSPDASFVCPISFVRLALPQRDGTTLVGGTNPGNLFRVKDDGSLDPTFAYALTNALYYYTLAAQPDGRIVLGGIGLPGRGINGIARLHSDGTVDPTFQAALPPDAYVSSVALQADGRVLVSGEFTTTGPVTRTNFVRLNADGTLDPTLPAAPLEKIDGFVIAPDGSILCRVMQKRVGSDLVDPHLVRLQNSGAATAELRLEGSSLVWLRSGSSPEVWRTFFQVSTNGRDWSELGKGEPIPGGWQLAGASVPAGATVRARGYVLGSVSVGNPGYNSSSWFVETMIGPPVITRQPTDITTDAGASAVFAAWGGGTGILGWQWLKDGVPLRDGAVVSGANTPNLTIRQVFGADEGNYAVALTDATGMVTSAVASLTIRDPAIVSQPGRQEVISGGSVRLSVISRGTPPLTYRWRKDGELLPVATSATLEIANADALDSGSYDVVVSSPCGAVTSATVTVLVNVGTLDSWRPQLSQCVATPVLAFAEQPDGRILIGGSFSMSESDHRIALGRWNAAGALDTTFTPPGLGSARPVVHSIAFQSDGKVLVGGAYVETNMSSGAFLVRLNADGALDTAFNPVPTCTETALHAQFVSALLPLPDGKLVVGGGFDLIAGQARRNLARLNPDGTLDETFAPSWVDGAIYSVAWEQGGRIIASGSFAKKLVRVNADGSLDSTFDPGPIEGTIHSLAVQADGNILVGGEFSTLAGKACTNLGRLDQNGRLDSGFRALGLEGRVTELTLQANGKLLIALHGKEKQPNTIRRLHPNGTDDFTFLTYVDNPVSAMALEADGDLLVGGSFSKLAGQNCTYAGRLIATEPATQTLYASDTQIQWLRAGSAPELWSVTFEGSANGSDWTVLGEGERIHGGWQLTGQNLPDHYTIRARGRTAGGSYSTSSWFIEAQARVERSLPRIRLAAGSSLHPEEGFRFQVLGIMGHRLLIEASTDLREWTCICTNQLEAEVYDFQDPDVPPAPMKYYRARLE